MANDYEAYQQDVSEDIETCLTSMECQPILFIGAGLSRRYFNAPTWPELLELLAEQCPLICETTLKLPSLF